MNKNRSKKERKITNIIKEFPLSNHTESEEDEDYDETKTESTKEDEGEEINIENLKNLIEKCKIKNHF